MVCTGAGRVGFGALFAAKAVSLTSFAGDIILDGGVGYVAHDVLLNSTWGDIYMTSLVLTAGNRTIAHSVGGSITGTAVFSNDFEAKTKYGSIAMIQAFIGLDTPADYEHGGFFPPALLTERYTHPRLSLATEYGGIAMIGLNAGTSTQKTAFNQEMTVDLTTVGGDIRVQVGGGAYEGPFNLTTQDGSREVELVAQHQGHTRGIIGPIPSKGKGHFLVHTKTGDIDFSAAANPGGAVAALLPA
jgi:DUF4097 and DUF4098 domain-containing protein YvlB